VLVPKAHRRATLWNLIEVSGKLILFPINPF
jgi:hypothetical protein